MYKLYSNKGVRTLLDVSENEQDIIDTVGEYLKQDENARFIIVYHQEYGDCITAIINKTEDYIEYMKNYKQKLESMTCIELKKEITKNVKIKKLKKK